MKKVSWLITSSILCTAFLAGCGHTQSTANNTSSNMGQTNPAAGGNTTSNQTGNTAGNTTSNQTNTAGNSTGSQTGNSSDSGSGSGNSASPSSGGNSASPSSDGNTSTTSMAAQEALVHQSMNLAVMGMAADVPFAVKQNIDIVQKTWGKTSAPTPAGAGMYATYGSHAAAFGLNKGDQIFDVRSFSKKLQTISAPAMEAVLGKPADTRQTSDSYIDMYPAGTNYQLLFVFPKNSSGSAGSTIDHVSVFWPAGTVNSMAATQPSPTIAIQSVTSGQVSFTIQNQPKGYRLVELEWIPRTGSAVVNTYSQALENPAASGTVVRFGASPPSSTLHFFNRTKFHGQSGSIRVIYQATSGAAMIGTSSTITLK